MSKPFTKMSKFKLVVMITMAVSLFLVNSASSQEPTCCSRAVTALRTSRPEPQERDDSKFISDYVEIIFFRSVKHDSPYDNIFDCPLKIEIPSLDGLNRSPGWSWLELEDIDQETGESAIQAGNIDYVIKPALILERVIEVVPGEWEEGYGGKPDYQPSWVIGDWNIRFALIDPHHGPTLKEVEASWTGNIVNDGRNTINSLAREFMPLDDFIHEYERLPELCDVQPEKESIEAGQTMTINVTDIVDSRMADPQPWQRICVHADKGKILNGLEMGDGWYVFEAGSGFVVVQYMAPQACENEQGEIQVWNSCNCTGDLDNTLPEKEIGRASFKIYDRKPEILKIRPEPIKVKVGDNASVRLTNIVDAEGKPLEPNEQVMVEVDKGRITNGMPLGGYKVFDVVQGHVDVNYQAPDDLSVNLDTIKIFNLCVKGDDLVEVVPHKLIAQKPIIIEFPPLVARITRTLEESRDTNIDETKGYSRKVRKGNSYSTKRVSIIARFSENPEGIHIPHKFQLPHGIKLPQGFQMMPAKLHYRMIDCRVVSETYTYNSEYYSAHYDAQGLTKEGTTRTVRNGRAGRINPPYEKNSIALKTDSSSGATKVNYVSVPFFDVEFLVDEHVEYKGKKEGTDRQLVPNNYSTSRNVTSNFTVQPTVVKDKEVCFKVTGGDGVRFMSGRCTETFLQPGDDLQRTTREVYEWQVNRR